LRLHHVVEVTRPHLVKEGDQVPSASENRDVPEEGRRKRESKRRLLQRKCHSNIGEGVSLVGTMSIQRFIL
jgi:hypothetical protein